MSLKAASVAVNNAFSFLGDEDEEEDVRAEQTATAGQSKKKKSKSKKKGSAAEKGQAPDDQHEDKGLLPFRILQAKLRL